MGDTELLEQLRAQVQSLRSPRSQQRAESGGSNNSGESGGRVGPKLPIQTVSSVGIRSRPSSRLAHQDSESPVVLNVGGVQYATSVGTLTSVEYSYFALMLNGVWEPSRTEEGHIFVDRNGKMFEYILEYLRDQNQKYQGEFQLPQDEKTLRGLLREAEFYQLPSLVARVKKSLDSLATVSPPTDALVVNDRKQALREASLNHHYEKEQFMRDQYDRDSDHAIKTDCKNEEVFGTDFDMVYDMVTSYTPTFAEERIQELVSKVNITLSPKFDDGYRVKDVNSGLVLDHSQQPPYSMYLQVVLSRAKKPGQSQSHHMDKFVPINPSSSAIVSGGPGRSYPSGIAYLPDCHYATSGRSTQDAVDMCSSEGDMRYQDSKNYSPRQHHRIPKPPNMVVSDHSYSASGPLGSPIPSGPDVKFSLASPGFAERPQGGTCCGQQHYDCRDYSGSIHYDHHHHHRSRRTGGDDQGVSPREHYLNANGHHPSLIDHQRRESPTRRVVSTNVPLLNLSVIGGMQGKGDCQAGYDKKGRPNSKQDFAKRVNGWGNNHPHQLGGIGTRIASPHPEFD